MKQVNLVCVMAGVLAAMSMPLYGQEGQEKETAKERQELAELKEDLKDARIDSAADYKKFKAQAEANITENQKKIGVLKARKISGSKEVVESYNHKIMGLEQQNNSLKERVKTSQDVKTSDWTAFKREFNHDMDELWKAIKDVGEDSTK